MYSAAISHLSFFSYLRYGFAHIGRVGSVLMTLSVTIERFVAIAYPLRRVNLNCKLITSSVLGAIFYNLPRFFELQTVEGVDFDNETQTNYTVSGIYFSLISVDILSGVHLYVITYYTSTFSVQLHLIIFTALELCT